HRSPGPALPAGPRWHADEAARRYRLLEWPGVYARSCADVLHRHDQARDLSLRLPAGYRRDHQPAALCSDSGLGGEARWNDHRRAGLCLVSALGWRLPGTLYARWQRGASDRLPSQEGFQRHVWWPRLYRYVYHN